MRNYLKIILFSILFNLIPWIATFIVISYLFQNNLAICIYEIFYPDWPNLTNSVVVSSTTITYPIYALALFLLLLCLSITVVSPFVLGKKFKMRSDLYKSIHIINFFFMIISFFIITFTYYSFPIQRKSDLLVPVASLLSLIVLLTSITILSIIINKFRRNKCENDFRKDSEVIPSSNYGESQWILTLLLFGVIAFNITLTILIFIGDYKGYDYYYHTALLDNLSNFHSIWENPFYEGIINTYTPGFHLIVISLSKIFHIPNLILFRLRIFLPSLFGGIAIQNILKKFDAGPTIRKLSIIITISWLNGLTNFGGNIVFPIAISLLFIVFMFILKSIKERKILPMFWGFLVFSLTFFIHLEVGFYGFLILFIYGIITIKNKNLSKKAKIIYFISLFISLVPVLIFIVPILSYIGFLPSIFSVLVPIALVGNNNLTDKIKKFLKQYFILIISISTIVIISLTIFIGFHGFGLESPLLIGINAPLGIISILFMPTMYLGFKFIQKYPTEVKYFIYCIFLVPYLALIRIFLSSISRIISPKETASFLEYVFISFHSYSSIISLVGVTLLFSFGLMFLREITLSKQFNKNKITIVAIAISLIMISNQFAFFSNSSQNGNFVSDQLIMQIEELRLIIPENEIIASDPHTSYLLASILGNEVIFSEHRTANNLIYSYLTERRRDLLDLLTYDNTTVAVNVLEKYNASYIVIWKNYPSELPTDVGTTSFNPLTDIKITVFQHHPFSLIQETGNFYIWYYFIT